MKRILFTLLIASLSMSTFAQSGKNRVQPIEYNQNVFTTVYIDAKGKIFVDGEKTKLKKLPQIITELKERKGFLKFAKAPVNKKSVQETNTEFFKILRKTGITIKVFTDKTFRTELLQ